MATNERELREAEQGFARACELNYMARIGATQAGQPKYRLTPKGTAQMVGDILLGYVAQADNEGHRDLNLAEKQELRLHLQHLLEVLDRS